METYKLNLTPLEVCALMDILIMAHRKELELNKLQDNHLTILKKVEVLDNKIHKNHSILKLKKAIGKHGRNSN